MKSIILIYIIVYSCICFSQTVYSTNTLHYNIKLSKVNFDSKDYQFIFTTKEFTQNFDFSLLGVNNNFKEFNLYEIDFNIPLQNDFLNKDHSSYFRNHCGYLKDGISLNTKASDVMLSRVFDVLINEYVLRSFLFKN